MKQLFPMERFRSLATPFYFYDIELLRRTLADVRKYSDFPQYHVHYALKANVNPDILQLISREGFGADAVSGGEIRVALESGFAPSSIVYAGVGKSDNEIILGLESGIDCFNVESLAELEVISSLANERGKVANVALRVNPNIDAHTHHYITTGLYENKFGIAIEMLDNVVAKALELPSICLKGLHFHIGSQITDFESFKMLCLKINEIQNHFNSKGITFSSINVGGGLGVDYENPDGNPIPDFENYFATFHKNLLLRDGQELHFELGRSMVAQCGSLITRVLYVKEGLGKRFAIVDAGFTDLIRPALYQAHHEIENISEPNAPLATYDVVGPICESSDTFGADEVLPEVHRGSLLALRTAGAYGEIMASRYNCRPLPPAYVSNAG